MCFFAQFLLGLLEIAHHRFIEEFGHGLSRYWFAIDAEFFVQISHLITRNADHTLDVIDTGTGWVSENHDVASCNRRALGNFQIGNWQTNAIVKFVHQN